MKDLAKPIAIGVVLVSLFSFFFVYPGHDPKPNDLPVGVVGVPAGAIGEGLDVRSYETLGGAREAILDREIYGAIGTDGALVASAASAPVAEILRGVAERGNVPNVVDVRPLDPDDPRGTSINLVVLPLTVTGILGALLIFGAAPMLPAPARLATLGVFALLGGFAAMLIVKAGIGVLPGSFVALWGLAALGLFTLAVCATAIIRALGPPGVGASFVLFLMLGNPASGAASAPHLLPDPWSWGGQLLPPGALATGVRNVAYFDGAQLAHWLPVLLVWAGLGVAGLYLLKPKGQPPNATR